MDLRTFAQATPGLSGADLATIVNEAALWAAVKKNAAEIGQQDIEDGRRKGVAWARTQKRRITEKANDRMAYHEVGHDLGCGSQPACRPRSQSQHGPTWSRALGYTQCDLPTGRVDDERLPRVNSWIGWPRITRRQGGGEAVKTAMSRPARKTIWNAPPQWPVKWLMCSG